MRLAELFETMEYGPAPESVAPALAWLEQRQPALGLFIGNRWVAPSGGDYFDSVNPATGKPLIQIAQASPADVDAAVQAARAAFSAWRETPGHCRARYLYALARQVQKHARLLAVLETLDNGKPIRETRDVDVPLVARHFAYHAGWAQLMATELAGFRPLGVVGQIIPWNFPLLMLAWKIAPALAAGNTVVLKPAELTSITALAFAEIARQVGLPPGVVNVVTGDGRVGELIVRHPDVDKIAFTGSTEVGRLIRRATARTGKKPSLELGGKSPFIVFDDADLDSAIEGLVDAIWFNQGQVCCAGSRLLVQENVAERFLARLRARMARLRIGDPLDKAVDLGAIVAPVQLERIQRLVQQGTDEGATVWQPPWTCPADGWFFPPTLVTDVSPAATIAQVEVFGPVLVAMTFRTPAEAVALANNTRYGLAASIWTETIGLALDVARQIKAGTVWVNSTNLFDAAAGFGGYRESGFGREGGKEGLYEYVKPAADDAELSGRQEPNPPTPFPTREGGVIVDDDSARKGGAMVNDDSPFPAREGGRGVRSLEEGPPAPPPLDRTPKLFVGGKQVRPDSGYSVLVRGSDGRTIGEVGEGNRKDVRNAVVAAQAAAGWASTTAYNRAQILYYIAENLSARADEFARRLTSTAGYSIEEARAEVEATLSRLFTYGAWADKLDGAVHQTPLRGLTLAIPEPLGVVGLVCPEEHPLLGVISLVAPAIAVGNTVVAIPSERHPLSAADLYQVLETSDLPGGVVNVVTGRRDLLAGCLAEHDAVDAVWYFGPTEGGQMVELASAGNLKRTWVESGPRDWLDPGQGEGPEFLRQASQIKNVWIPHGE